MMWLDGRRETNPLSSEREHNAACIAGAEQIGSTPLKTSPASRRFPQAQRSVPGVAFRTLRAGHGEHELAEGPAPNGRRRRAWQEGVV